MLVYHGGCRSISNDHLTRNSSLCQNVVRSSKGLNYMVCVTAIEPDWLAPLALHTPMLSFNPPLSSPPPSFDPSRDAVVFYCVPKFGSRAWELRPFPLTAQDLVSALSSLHSSSNKINKEWKADALREDECRWFVRLLLEGQVLSGWACLYRQATGTARRTHGNDDDEDDGDTAMETTSLLSSPVFLNDPPALITYKRPLRKVLEVVQPLLNENISSLAALRKQWLKDPLFLKRGIKLWIRPERKTDFESLWRETVGRPTHEE